MSSEASEVDASATEARPPRRRRGGRRRKRERPSAETAPISGSPTNATGTGVGAPETRPTPEVPAPKMPTPEVTAPEVKVPEMPGTVTTDVAERKIAMFCDLENLALGVRDSELKRLDVALLLERLLEKGKIIVKRAYADWERYSEYKRPFHDAAVELIDIPRRFSSGKNSADIKLVVDAMDLCHSKDHLDTFVIVSGDSDFSPLVSKLKENDKYVIGIGVKSSASNLLIDNCDEFIYYEDMWRDVQKTPRLDHLSPKDAEVFGLMIEAVVALVRENKDVLWGSMIKRTMKRKRPSFSESYYGYSSFSELLEDAQEKRVVTLTRDRRSGGYAVTGFASPS